MPFPDQPSYIGIDLGTSGCRGISIDAQGRILADSHRCLPPSHAPYPRWAEQQPADWWQATLEIIRELIAATPAYHTTAIAVDGTSSSLLLTDSDGRPLTPGLMYNDQRAQSESQQLAKLAAPESAVHGPSSGLAKLLWLGKRFSLNNSHALHQSEWISGCLCRNFTQGDENNCLKLGYDPMRRRWPDWMRQLPIPPSVLPNVYPVGTHIGTIHDQVAKVTGLSTDCRVCSGTTDSTAAALAAGINQIGDALTSLGSTLVCKILSEQPVFNADYGVYSQRISDYWLVGGASNSGGTVLRQYFTDTELQTLSQQINPCRSLCLDYYPLPSTGERFPFCNPDMEPRLTPVPKNRQRFLQAILEGLSNIEKLAYTRLHSLGTTTPGRILTSGGGAKNHHWSRMRERIVGIPVQSAQHQQAAFGAAKIARQSLAVQQHPQAVV